MKNILITIIVALCAVMAAHAETVTYYHTDALGTPVAATDESGHVLWREHYSPFGEKLDDSQASQSSNVGYTGHQFDSDTGLVYMQARYYDPVIGRFYSNDPIGFRDVHSFNRYTYANNNPYKYIDPDGKESISAVLADNDVRALGKGNISKNEFKKRQLGRFKSARVSARFIPIGRVLLTAINGLEVVLNEDATSTDDDLSPEEILEEKRKRRQDTIDDYVDGYLPGVNDNHGMEGENNKKEDQVEENKKKEQNE